MVDMEVETRSQENGTEITVESEKRIAVVVEDEEERIYLPEPGGEDSSYYTGEVEGLSDEEDVYTVLHEGAADSIEVFTK